MKNTLFVTLLLVQTIITAAQTKHLIPFRQKNRWGFCDTLGKIVIQPKYDSTDFFGGHGFVSSEAGLFFTGGRQGLISFSGKIIIPASYDEIIEKDEHYAVKKSNKHGLYTEAGKLVLPVKFDAITTASYHTTEYFLTTNNKKQGLYNGSTGKLIPAIYDVLTDDFYSEKVDRNKWFYAEKGKEKFLISKQTFEIIRYKGEEDLADMGESLMAAPVEELQMVNTENEDMKKIKESFEADEITRYQNGDNAYALNAKVYKIKKGGKTGLAFANTFTLLSPIYDSVSYVISIFNGSNYFKRKSYYLIAAKKEKYFGLINEGAEEILPFQYDLVTSMPTYATAFLTVLNNKQGLFLPYTFYPPIKPKYGEISYRADLRVNSNWSFAIFKTVTNGKTGYVGENGVEYFKN